MAGTLYFVRHGQSVANAGGRSLPHHSVPLTDKGHGQAQDIAQALPGQAPLVLVSELVRTHQTSEPYCARIVAKAQPLALLNEFNPLAYDLIAGLDGDARRPIAVAYWSFADPAQRTGREADSFHDFVARVDAFIAEMDALPDGTVIFGHGTWMGMLKWRLEGKAAATGQDMTAFRTFMNDLAIGNCAVFAAQQRPDGAWRMDSQVRGDKAAPSVPPLSR